MWTNWTSPSRLVQRSRQYLDTIFAKRFSSQSAASSSSVLALVMVRSSVLFVVAVTVAAFFMPLVMSGARNVKSGGTKFVVQGWVYRDTYRIGFETHATSYIAGAKVRVECRTRDTGVKTCNFDGVTDETETYKILVADEHEYEICESVLVESLNNACNQVVDGRQRAHVSLTRNNGIASDTRFANALGFLKDTPLGFCGQLIKQYEEYGV